jgi:hypothetical protein
VQANQAAFLTALPVDLTIDLDEDKRLNASGDVFSLGAHLPFAVLVPTTIEQVQKIWVVADKYGIALVNRGAGLSYTSAVVPSRPGMAVLDLTKMNSVGTPEQLDRCITVEGGATWKALDHVLVGTKLRVALSPPISGGVSTIGGALAQGLPAGLEAVIGVDVVTPQGALIKIGPAHFGEGQCGGHRMMGADLLGLFIGTGGIFGTIVRAHLRLEPIPQAMAFRSYAVHDLGASAELITQLALLSGRIRLIAMPVRREADLAQIPTKEKINTALKSLSASGGIGDFSRRAGSLVQSAFGPRQVQDKSACVHVIIEAGGADEASRVASQVDAIALDKAAVRVSAALPAIMQSRPYSLRGMLGPTGQRWVPVHAIGALSQLSIYASATVKFFKNKQSQFDANDIETSWLIMAWPGKCAVLEPMFMWPAPLLPAHKHAGDIFDQNNAEWTDVSLKRTELVAQYRAELVSELDAVGALHVQLGKSYPYRSRLAEPVADLVGAIKTHLDPAHLASPDNLGFK